ncbi:MAG: hypothetical protein MI975_03335 [Cytophagales bacterium]|nr:hypothetical protein [Cytophagales bacterium]
MRNCIMLLCSLLLIAIMSTPALSQGLLKKLKKQTEQKILKKTDEVLDDAVFGEDNDNPNNPGNTSNPGSTPGSNTANTTGGGLVVEPPDVLKNIDDAEQAFNVQNYGTARFSVRQAMLGIEMEIGHNILEELPKTVDGLNYVENKDKVTSMSYGFVGLTLERVYQGGNKELRLSVGNNSALLSAANMMLASGAYSTSSTDQNYKQTTFKGYRSVLEYDNSSGYTLSVPFGQSSIFVLNGRNYSSEGEMMAAAENFDIEPIKKELGEK